MEKQEIIIEKLRRVACEYVSDEVAVSARVEMSYDVARLGRTLCAMIDLPKEPLKTVHGETSYTIPATWFDHLRNEHFPNFLVRKYPINFRTQKMPVDIEVGVVYPQFRHAFPDKSADMRYYQLPKLSAYSMEKDYEDEP